MIAIQIGWIWTGTVMFIVYICETKMQSRNAILFLLFFVLAGSNSHKNHGKMFTFSENCRKWITTTKYIDLILLLPKERMLWNKRVSRCCPNDDDDTQQWLRRRYYTMKCSLYFYVFFFFFRLFHFCRHFIVIQPVIQQN